MQGFSSRPLYKAVPPFHTGQHTSSMTACPHISASSPPLWAALQEGVNKVEEKEALEEQKIAEEVIVGDGEEETLEQQLLT
jgi:hypothetical protein